MGLLSVLGASHWIFKIRWVAVAKFTALWWTTVHWGFKHDDCAPSESPAKRHRISTLRVKLRARRGRAFGHAACKIQDDDCWPAYTASRGSQCFRIDPFFSQARRKRKSSLKGRLVRQGNFVLVSKGA